MHCFWGKLVLKAQKKVNLPAHLSYSGWKDLGFHPREFTFSFFLAPRWTHHSVPSYYTWQWVVLQGSLKWLLWLWGVLVYFRQFPDNDLINSHEDLAQRSELPRCFVCRCSAYNDTSQIYERWLQGTDKKCTHLHTNRPSPFIQTRATSLPEVSFWGWDHQSFPRSLQFYSDVK